MTTSSTLNGPRTHPKLAPFPCGLMPASLALSDFMVNRFGPRSILFTGLALLGVATFAVTVGIMDNGVFHPADYTLVNRTVSQNRLGHAYSVHGITGSLGWSLVVTLTLAYSWRVVLAEAGVLAFAALAVLLVHRDKVALNVAAPAKGCTG